MTASTRIGQFSERAIQEMLRWLPELELRKLWEQVAEIAARPEGATKRLTKKAFKSEAQELSAGAASMIKLLEQSSLVPLLGVYAAVVRLSRGGTVPHGWDPLKLGTMDKPQRLTELLQELHDLASSVAAAADDPSCPQPDLPAAGRKPDVKRRAITHTVMLQLWLNGANLGTATGGAGVTCVEHAFEAVGISASAEAQVKQWLADHPKAPGGARYICGR